LSSTDIAGNITHGWGELDNNGFWEHPCPSTLHAEQDELILAMLKEHWPDSY
jgi:hypothetical protein